LYLGCTRLRQKACCGAAERFPRWNLRAAQTMDRHPGLLTGRRNRRPCTSASRDPTGLR
jgi:hypothetical protein